MQIPLDSFEQYVPEPILKRGLGYFKKGKVETLQEVSPRHYKTIIEGSDLYTVKFALKNNMFTDYSCSCPYDSSLICKHLVAVMFYLQRDRMQLEETPAKKIRTNPAPKNKVRAEHPVHPEIEVSEESVRNRLKYILRRGEGRRGFIEWDSAREVGKQVEMLLDGAEKQIGSQQYMNAFLSCSVILEEMNGVLQYADDSNGDIGGNIERAMGLLNELASAFPPENIRSEFFNYCLRAFKKGDFDGWDWHLGILKVAAKLAANKTEGKKITDLLDKADLSEYEVEDAQVIRYGIIMKVSGDKEADKFLEQHIHYPDIRKLAIEHAISEGVYDKAAGLAYAGIKQDKRNNDWYEYLLKIAQEQQDDVKIIENARYLFLHEYRENLQYFDVLKLHVEKEQWRDFMKKLTEDAGKHKHYGIETLAYIFTSEEQWDKLLELLAKNSSFENIRKYEKFLQQDKAVELADLYEREILHSMKDKTGRGYYVEVCRYIRRMIKLGQRQKAELLIENLRKAYPQRRALLEELALI